MYSVSWALGRSITDKLVVVVVVVMVIFAVN